MPNVGTWMQRKDEKWFHPIFARRPEICVWNALRRKVPLEKMDGLLLTGGADIAQDFLRQAVPDLSVLEKAQLERDRWEFGATMDAL